MKKFLWVTAAILFSAQALSDQADCGADVDMADSLNFSKLHIECAHDPVVVYDPDSSSSFFKGKDKAVNTYSDSAEKASIKAAAVTGAPAFANQNRVTEESLTPAVGRTSEPQASSNAGVVFNIREPFSITGGPASALNGLFTQMAHYCPAGWEKLKEWSVPNQSDYYLIYQFQCAE